MNCQFCGHDLTNTLIKSSVGKNSGKPYKAKICPNCRKYNFINDETPKPAGNGETSLLQQILEELKKLNRHHEHSFEEEP